jgi:hypothetical protein
MKEIAFLAAVGFLLLATPTQAAQCWWNGWSWECAQPPQERHERQEWRDRREWYPPVQLHQREHGREPYEREHERR